MNSITKARPRRNSSRWSYNLNGARYNFSLSDLRKDYKKYLKMSDAIFTDNLLQIAHYCCIAGYYNDLKPEITIGDAGIIHEIIHLATWGEFFDETDKVSYEESFKNVRKLFKKYFSV